VPTVLPGPKQLLQNPVHGDIEMAQTIADNKSDQVGQTNGGEDTIM
jgi:hypothetical protein